MKESRIEGVLTPILAQFGLELEALEVIPAGKRRLLRIVVDGDGPEGRGPLLDDIASASRECAAELDGSDMMGAAAYTLEVSSRGVSRPLELPRHWRRNLGRLVKVTLGSADSDADTDRGGDVVLGRIVDADEMTVRLDVEGTESEIALSAVRKALIQVEFNRRSVDTDGEDD